MVNLCFKFNTKFTLKLETDLQKLFETNLNATNIPTTIDAEIIFNSARYIQYEQIKLNYTFRTYLEGTLISEDILRTDIKPTPYQKTYEIIRGSQSHVADFIGANEQFSFVQVSLVYDKSNQHKGIFDSYNIEIASMQIKLLKLEIAANTYSTFTSVKYGTADDHDKYLLYC